MSKLAKTIVLTAVAAFFCSGEAGAEQWKILGPRPMGMGGAFVAVAKGPIAQYWNPAGLAQEENTSGLELPIGARAEFTGGVLQDANALGRLVDKYQAVQSAQTAGGKIDADQMATVVKGIATISGMNEPGKGLLADVEGGVNFKFSKIAVSINNYTSVGASPFVDSTNIGLGSATGITGVSFASGGNVTAPADTASRDTLTTALNSVGTFPQIENMLCGSGGCLNAQLGGLISNETLANTLINATAMTPDQVLAAANIIQENAVQAAPVIQNLGSGVNNPYSNNQSNLTVRGGSFTELAFGYARPVLIPGLIVGGNLKAIFGSVGYTRFNVLQNDAGTTDALKDYNKNLAKSVRPGIDIGLLMEADKYFTSLPMKPRFGLVMRNINSPGFDQPSLAINNGESSKLSYDSQMRAGLAVSPFNFWTLAMDMDVTKNKTPVRGYKSRQLSLGTEVNIFNRPSINIPLRVGLIKNIADSASKPAYTAGFGINLLHMILDVGGSISSETIKLDDGGTVRSSASVAASLAFLF
ncbi:MAG: conjugal transfer protein TraF [bacterium]